MKTILCVEDELPVLANHRDALIEAGYSVLTAENLEQARKHLSKVTPDAIVLDIMLPDGNGLEFLKELRALGSRIPVIMLTAWNTDEDIAKGLRAGANDYIGKPFDYKVLIARVEAMFRNVEQVPETVEKGPLKLDVMASRAFLNDEDMLLTQKEFAVLLLLAQHESRTVSAEYLYEKVWRMPMISDSQAIRTIVSRLRLRIKGSGYDIKTLYKGGYRFQAVNTEKTNPGNPG